MTIRLADVSALPRVVSPVSSARATWPGWLLMAALIAFAFNLRPAVASIAPILTELRTDLNLSAALAGLLTTLPVLCFAGVGAVAAGLSRRFGLHAVLVVAAFAVFAGQAIRVVFDATPVFFVATVLALAGIAAGNVLLPAFVKAHYPNRVGVGTAAYTTSMSVGTVLPAALTVPIAEAVSDWHVGVGVWALAALAAGLLTLPLLKGAQRPTTQGETRRTSVVRSPLAWSLALFMGLQALQAYAMFGWLPQIFRDAGLDAAHAGLLFSVIPLVGIPLSLVLPGIAVKLGNQTPMVIGFVSMYVLGYLGLWLAPDRISLLWVTLIGIGMGAFPLALTMIGLRSRSSDITASLSSFVQSIGYLVAAAGPLAIGALYGATGGWTVPIWVLLVLLVPQLILGLLASRERYVDDQLTSG